jgi:hypothetical protein
MSDAPESLPPMPELQEDLVYCRNCDVTEFAGTNDEALQAGWVDEDWGMTCPKCVEDLGRQEEGVLFSGAASLKNLASVLKGEV